VNTSISAGRSKVAGNIKRTPNRNLSKTTITTMTIITNADPNAAGAIGGAQLQAPFER
jgi:hypothetical protein